MKTDRVDEDEPNIFHLISKLRQEKLYIKNEKNCIRELNELIKSKTHDVIKFAWTTNRQRLILYQKQILSQKCQEAVFTKDYEFLEAKNTLGFQNSVKLANLLQILRSQPKQLATWLLSGELITQDKDCASYFLVLQTVVNGLYGSLIFPEDTKLMLTLLYELAKLQLLKGENPRRVLKQRTCSFRHLYFLFHEVLQPAKCFLITALEVPILELLSYSDFHLDMDPDKTLMRFELEENLITFQDAIEYRNEVVRKLADFTNSFVLSILENVSCFPKSIAWIVYQVAKQTEKQYGAREANAVTTELIFTLFICPVIVDPEQYGICNSQITDVSRHNLIQVGKILQSLALHKFEPTDIKYKDIFDQLDKNSMSNFIDLLFFDLTSNEPPVDTLPAVTRDIMLFTEHEINNLVLFLQKVQLNRIHNDNFDKVSALSVSIEEHLASLSLSPSRDNSPNLNLHRGESEPSPKKPVFFSIGSKNHTQRTNIDEPKNPQNVLVFPIDRIVSEPIGLLPEEKVIDLTVPVKTEEIFDAVKDSPDNPTSQNGEIKHSFSSYHDEGSIGNTSDNLEAISEAASNHSVASSLEMENEDQNDNLSDMVSANVSGRGTPNISGRDTPSSQVNENEDRINAENPENRSENNSTRPQSKLSRQIRSEIDDKFCKFEIKKLLEGEETISIISETWSTDVLASDNETVDANETRNERQSSQFVEQAVQDATSGSVLDMSETQSESAWSTDVMASDIERLTEIDNDDTASVAQSDDTNARSDDTRSETDEVAGMRRLSSSSNSFISPATNQSYVASVTVNNTNYGNGVQTSSTYVSSNSSFVSTSNHYVHNSRSFTPLNQNYVGSDSFHESEKMNGKVVTGMGPQTDNNANTVFKPLYSEIKTSIFTTASSVTTVFNHRLHNVAKESDLIDVAGPSGLHKLDGQQSHAIKLDERPNEILLSNCSLNSSSSGSNSNSFENKTSNNENSERWENKPWLNSSGSSLNVTLTPSESTSELSVLSVNNMSNPVNILSKKTATLLPNSFKPIVSTGAIPKSISFDMSVNKGLDDDHRSKRGGFFGKLRNLRRRGKSLRHQDDLRGDNDECGMKKAINESPIRMNNCTDASYEILAKYRSKPFVDNSPIKENCDVRERSPKERNSDGSDTDLNSFSDIKKKLRLVLSNTSEIPYHLKNNPTSVKNKIKTILRLELGKARKLREWSSVARMSEALRCINLLNDKSCLKLFQSMKEDLALRSAYIQYLITSKQELLFCDTYLNSLQEQILHDKYQCEGYFAMLCVREFLAHQEVLTSTFCDEFKQLSLADEKCDFLLNFYHRLYSIMDANSFWHDALQCGDAIIKTTLERYIMSKVYTNALYPNGDGDRDRDRVLREHIEKLSKIITPDHKDLLIPKTYLRESPWLPAQDALRALNSCRTPRDKVKCVLQCAKCIMDLLSLSQSNGSTAADDFTPVLVYVIIKVNPEALLSTIQFVNTFLDHLFGEEEYWWTQFCAAVEYIKTMDYSD